MVSFAEKYPAKRGGMKRFLLMFAALATLATWSASPQTTKPNFSGRWEMDREKSHFYIFPEWAPSKVTQIIDHQEPKLKITTQVVSRQGAREEHVAEFTTDGKESISEMNAMQTRSKVHWQERTLVQQWKQKQKTGNWVDGTTTYKFSEDGKNLICEERIKFFWGEEIMTKLLMVKSSPE